MKPSVFVSSLALALALTAGQARADNPHVVLETSMGELELELYPDKAPLSVKNYLEYVKSGHYEGTIFHRVIKGFMIQGGGFSTSLVQKPTKAPIKNEAGNGLKNGRGTLAMARTGVVDSATAQFFINLVDNSFLDHKSKDPRGYGYAVFGKVVRGMDVVDKIGGSPTGACGPFRTDCPTTQVVIRKARIVEPKAAKPAAPSKK